MCNLYLFFASLQTNTFTYIELWPWLLCTGITFAAVQLFLRQERPLEQLVYLGGVCFAATTLVMSLWFIHATGLVAWLFAWLFFASTAFVACTAPLGAFKPQTLLLCCECPALGIIFLFIVDTNERLYFPPYFALCSIGILLFTLLALTLSRFDTHATVHEHKKGAVLSTTGMCFALMAALAIAFMQFATKAASLAVTGTANFINFITTAILSMLNAIVNFLFSLFPTVQEDYTEIETIAAVSIETQGDGMASINTELLAIFTLLATFALIAFVLVWLVRTLKKGKMRGTLKTVAYHRPKAIIKRAPIGAKLRLWLQQKWDNFAFSLALFRQRNTPQGAAILLERCGAKRGAPKHTGESYHAYLLRIAAHLREDDSAAAHSLRALAAQLDETLYARDHRAQTLPHGHTRVMHRAVARLPQK